MVKKRKVINHRYYLEPPIRCSKEFKSLINEIRAKYVLAGKKPPSIVKITDYIAQKIRKERLLRDEIIRF